MTLDVLVLCGAVTGAVLLILPVREMKNSYYPIAITALSMLITAYTLRSATPLINYFAALSDGDAAQYFKILIKVLGITMVCNITSDLALELGMSTLSGKVEFAGKIAVLLSAMPLFDTLLSQVESFI